MAQKDPYEKGLEDGEAVAKAAGGVPPAPKKGDRMYVRTQSFSSSDEDLRFLQRNGVRHKAGRFPFHPQI